MEYLGSWGQPQCTCIGCQHTSRRQHTASHYSSADEARSADAAAGCSEGGGALFRMRTCLRHGTEPCGLGEQQPKPARAAANSSRCVARIRQSHGRRHIGAGISAPASSHESCVRHARSLQLDSHCWQGFTHWLWALRMALAACRQLTHRCQGNTHAPKSVGPYHVALISHACSAGCHRKTWTTQAQEMHVNARQGSAPHHKRLGRTRC